MAKYISLLFIFLCSTLHAADTSPWFSEDNGKVRLNVELYTTSTCPICKKAKEFMNDQVKQREWINLKIYTINQSTDDLMSFYQRLKMTGTTDYMVPSFFYCGVRFVGFKTAETSGKDILKSLDFCRQKIEMQHKLSSSTKTILTRWASGPFQQAQAAEPFSWQNVFLMAFFDAADPCAFFAFVLLLSFVVSNSSSKIRLKLGLILFLLMALGHYLQQVEAIFYYHSLLWLRGIAVIAGAGLLLWVREIYSKEQVSMIITGVLAGVAFFLTYLYQQSCSDTNVALSFQNWLTNLQLPVWKQLVVQAIYQICYLLPAILIYFIILYFFSEKTPLRRQYYAKYTAMMFICITAIILIFHPLWLSSLITSVVAGLVSLFVGWLGLRRRLHYYG